MANYLQFEEPISIIDEEISKAKEIEIKLLERERNGDVPSGDALKKFRTGELRSFIELCKSAQNQGSRRITMALSELNLKDN